MSGAELGMRRNRSENVQRQLVAMTVPFTELTDGQWMDLTEDGTLLVTASQFSEARLWDLEAGTPLGAPFPDPGLEWVGGDARLGTGTQLLAPPG